MPGSALWTQKFVMFDGPFGPWVLRFDSGFAAEGCGGGHWTAPLALKVQRVHRIQRLLAQKVLRIDQPMAGGFLGLTALRAEGCGGRFAAK